MSRVPLSVQSIRGQYAPARTLSERRGADYVTFCTDIAGSTQCLTNCIAYTQFIILESVSKSFTNGEIHAPMIHFICKQPEHFNGILNYSKKKFIMYAVRNSYLCWHLPQNHNSKEYWTAGRTLTAVAFTMPVKK